MESPGDPLRSRLVIPAVLLMLACAGQNEAPPRPVAVPSDTGWVQGKTQDGVWVRLRTVGGLDWRVEVWSDLDGHKLTEGRFLVKGVSLGELKPEDLDSWDGERFALRGGGTLERAR
jgi:hypothetical protein